VEEETRKGLHLTPPVVSYFKEIQANLEKELPTEEVEIMVEAAWEEATQDGRLYRVMVHNKLSKVLEQLLVHTSPARVTLLCQALAGMSTDNLLSLWTDRNASHVLEHLFDKLPRALTTPPQEEEVKHVSDSIKAMGEKLKSHWIDLMSDAYGSHLVRTLLLLLQGETKLLQSDKTKKKKGANEKIGFTKMKNEEELKNQRLEQEYLRSLDPLMNDIYEVVINVPSTNIQELECDRFCSPALQGLLQCLHIRSMWQMENTDEEKKW